MNGTLTNNCGIPKFWEIGGGSNLDLKLHPGLGYAKFVDFRLPTYF